jgi:hypothetical protein
MYYVSIKIICLSSEATENVEKEPLHEVRSTIIVDQRGNLLVLPQSELMCFQKTGRRQMDHQSLMRLLGRYLRITTVFVLN